MLVFLNSVPLQQVLWLLTVVVCSLNSLFQGKVFSLGLQSGVL